MQQRGFTLLEVLVALVVVAIGLVGIAGLMMTGARNNQSAAQRSQASWLAYDVIDRMRANKVVAQSGAYNVALGSAPASTGVAQTDLTTWRTMLSTMLPSGDGSVQVIGSVVTVQVRWDDSRGLSTLNVNNFAGNGGQVISVATML